MTLEAPPQCVTERTQIPAWLTSTALHALLLAAIALIQVPESRRRIAHIINLVPTDSQTEARWDRIDFRKLPVGDESGGAESAVEFVLPTAPVVTTEPSIADSAPHAVPGFEAAQTVALATGKDFYRRFKTKGLAGIGTANAALAIDRLTKEVLLSLEERPTLVVWLMDQSASLIPQRKEIHDRFDRIYRELGTIQSSGALAKSSNEPLLTSIMAFGQSVSVRLDKPTSDVQRLKQAMVAIERDDSGIENVFQCVVSAASNFRKFRRIDRDTSQPLRNVMFIVITDEAGDDPQLLEQAVDVCSKIDIPVFVVGVPAPFGQQETFVKWVDPDPGYDQTPGWGRVNQGPETALAQRVRLGFSTDPKYEVPIDSGFGPYALTRLCYETGGIYFAVHADRHRRRAARRRQVKPFSAHLAKFFDEETMRRYRPDYVPLSDYRALVAQNAARQALVKAAQESWIGAMQTPRLEFIVESEAQFAAALTEAQKAAAVLEPRLQRLLAILETGELDREKETQPRWQAGFDLAMGRTLATLARTKTYNAVLAEAKRGLTPTRPNNNTWSLDPADQVEVSRDLQNAAESAQRYLQRVVNEHPDTPWAFLAKRELRRPLGWQWSDSYTPSRAEVARAQQQRNRLPRDDRARSVPRPQKRPVPKL